MSKYPGYEWDGTSSESSEDNWNQKSKSDGYNWDGGILEESKQDSLLRSHFSAIGFFFSFLFSQFIFYKLLKTFQQTRSFR